MMAFTALAVENWFDQNWHNELMNGDLPESVLWH